MIRLTGDNGEIEIEVLDYQDPSAECRDDRNWLNCSVRAHIGSARFEVGCMIQTYDVRHLYEELQSGSELFVWSFPEDDISLEFGIKTGFTLMSGLNIAKVAMKKRLPRHSTLSSPEREKSFAKASVI